MKWLRCLQCNQKFPENEFKAHQRESKSPCELVRSPRDCRPPRRPRYTRAPVPTFHLRVAFLEAHEDAAAGVLFARAAPRTKTSASSRKPRGFERMTVARATPSRNSTVFLPLLVSSARVSPRPHRAPGPIRRTTPPSPAPPAASPLFGQQPNRRARAKRLIHDRSRSRSLPQVKCGVCHELLLRGQKEEHEKVCLGRVCRPLAAKNPAAAAGARPRARLARFSGTREPKLAALRGGANKNGKDSADIVPPAQGERRAQSSRVHARDASLPRRTFPRARLSRVPNPARKAPALTPGRWRIPTRAST